jgi:hypothetical protein
VFFVLNHVFLLERRGHYWLKKAAGINYRREYRVTHTKRNCWRFIHCSSCAEFLIMTEIFPGIRWRGACEESEAFEIRSTGRM